MYTLKILSMLMFLLAGRPVLTHTVWQNERKEFVADAGNMTVTTTLEFLSATKVVMRYKSVMPSHPAMYVNPDGSIDTIEGWTSDWESNGTYKCRRGKIIITFDDESTMELLYQKVLYNAGVLVGEKYGEKMVFEKQE